MNPTNRIAKLGSMVLVVVTTLAVALGGQLLAPAAPVYADTGTPPVAYAGGRVDERLARLYDREQHWLDLQADNLEHANEAVTRAQERVAGLKSQGKDTAALEAALAAIKQQIAAAQTAHDGAASILASHAGFGDGGKVIDREQARQTVTGAGDALRDAQLALKQARLDLLKALHDWRKANRK
jgi:hypothetical protein